MLTRRKPSGNNGPRWFAARMNKDDEALLAATQARMAEHMGDRPSHAILLNELLRVYLAKAA